MYNLKLSLIYLLFTTLLMFTSAQEHYFNSLTEESNKNLKYLIITGLTLTVSIMVPALVYYFNINSNKKINYTFQESATDSSDNTVQTFEDQTAKFIPVELIRTSNSIFVELYNYYYTDTLWAALFTRTSYKKSCDRLLQFCTSLSQQHNLQKEKKNYVDTIANYLSANLKLCELPYMDNSKKLAKLNLMCDQVDQFNKLHTLIMCKNIDYS